MIYADNAATTRLSATALAAMLPYLTEQYGNPSSLYTLGQTAATALAQARETVARCLHCRPEEIVFTSGGSEADNQAILSAARWGKRQGKTHIISTAFEHHAVLHTLQKLEKEGFTVTLLDVHADGRITPQQVEAAITQDTCLVTVMYANNEIGTIQPIGEIGAICRARKVPFHTSTSASRALRGSPSSCCWTTGGSVPPLGRPAPPGPWTPAMCCWPSAGPTRWPMAPSACPCVRRTPRQRWTPCSGKSPRWWSTYATCLPSGGSCRKERETMLYSEKVMDHFRHPRNVGILEDADGVGEVGNAKCGDIMKIYLKIDHDTVTDVKFETFGCGSAIASSSMATEMIKGKPLTEVMGLTNRAVAQALDGLPAHKLHCSVLAEEAVKAALKDYYDRNHLPYDPQQFPEISCEGCH